MIQNAVACLEGPCIMEPNDEAFRTVHFSHKVAVKHKVETDPVIVDLHEHHNTLIRSLYGRVIASHQPDASHPFLNDKQNYPNKVTASIGLIGLNDRGLLQTIHVPVGRYGKGVEDSSLSTSNPYLFTSSRPSQDEIEDIEAKFGCSVSNEDVEEPIYTRAAENFTQLTQESDVEFQKHMHANVKVSAEAYEKFEDVAKEMTVVLDGFIDVLEEKVPGFMKLYAVKRALESDYQAALNDSELKRFEKEIKAVQKEHGALPSLRKIALKALQDVSEKPDDPKTFSYNDLDEDQQKQFEAYERARQELEAIDQRKKVLEETLESLRASEEAKRLDLKIAELESQKKEKDREWLELKQKESDHSDIYCHLIEKLVPFAGTQLEVDERFEKTLTSLLSAVKDISSKLTIRGYEIEVDKTLINLSKTQKRLEVEIAALEDDSKTAPGALEGGASKSKKKKKVVGKKTHEELVQELEESLKETLRYKDIKRAINDAKQKNSEEADKDFFKGFDDEIEQLYLMRQQLIKALKTSDVEEKLILTEDEKLLGKNDYAPSNYLMHNIIFMGHSEQALLDHLLHHMGDERFGYAVQFQQLLAQESIQKVTGVMLNFHTQRNMCKCCAASMARFLDPHLADPEKSPQTAHMAFANLMKTHVLSHVSTEGFSFSESLKTVGIVSFTDDYDPRQTKATSIRNLMTFKDIHEIDYDHDALEEMESGQIIQVKFKRPKSIS